MAEHFKLSICIPTFNRGDFIGETLDSIIEQAPPEVEIVVSDNHSEDQTENIVALAKARFPNLRYHRWDRNMGADRNFLKVVELARGEFCWLMGSDDRVEPGGIQAVLDALARYPGLAGMSLNRNGYDREMKTRIPELPVAGGKLAGETLFTDAAENFSILGEYFGYISGQVVRRSLWQEVVQSEENLADYFNAYIHIFVIVRMLQKNPRWLYLDVPCVGWRSGNDSFLSEGMYRRLVIDVVGYEKIARDTFGKRTPPYDNLMRTIGTVQVRAALDCNKWAGAPASFYLKALPLCVKAYWPYPKFWVRTFPFLLGYLVVPNWAFQLLVKVVRGVRQLLGAAA